MCWRNSGDCKMLWMEGKSWFDSFDGNVGGSELNN